MKHLANRNILLGITGSVAAYKAVELIRLLREGGANVRVVMTEEAKEFITELTLQAVCGQPVYSELFNKDVEASMSHITLAKWADLLLIAPATANIMAKFSTGMADDLLTTLYLACSAPVMIAPAMNQQMWHHKATQRNLIRLESDGVTCVGPGDGIQACGDMGFGRLLEPIELIRTLEEFFQPKLLSGKKVIITAGPTREKIDPVRYVSNYSSGKMGYALAAAAQKMGANVTLISGPTSLTLPTGVHSFLIETAEEMLNVVMKSIEGCDLFIAAAAVGDFTVKIPAKQKIKKPILGPLELQTTEDILLSVSHLKSPPFLVGFAAESENLIENAKKKLHEKKLDLVVANQVGLPGSGFESDYNEVTVITAKEEEIFFPHASKELLAYRLLKLFAEKCCAEGLSSEVSLER